jgi:hypothetical protein
VSGPGFDSLQVHIFLPFVFACACLVVVVLVEAQVHRGGKLHVFFYDMEHQIEAGVEMLQNRRGC